MKSTGPSILDPWHVYPKGTAPPVPPQPPSLFTTADLEKMKGRNASGWTRCIFFTRLSGCSSADGCRFWHDTVEPGEKAALESLHAERMARRPTNGAKMGACWEFQSSGKCKFGTRCKFEHGEVTGGTAGTEQ